jgi:dTDP-glucose 4,6-dehydratase
MRSVLVTGGAGFIGSSFVRALLADAPDTRIVTLDALTYAGSRDNLADLSDPSRHTFVHGDIRDAALVDRLMREHAIDTVVHFAAETHVDRSIAGPAAFIDTNIHGTFCLLEAARRAFCVRPDGGRRLFLHVSTDEVFGSLAPGAAPVDETARYAPSSPYAASKAASDHLVQSHAHTYGLPVALTHCSNNYGPRQFPEKLIPVTIMNALLGAPLPIYGDGAQIRDWIHVEDHCEALLRILREGRPGDSFNIGSGVEVKNLDLVRRICVLLDQRFPDSPHCPHERLIRFVGDRPGHDRRYALDSSKIRRVLGWAPRRSLDEGLVETITWYVEHARWLSAIGRRADFAAWIEENYGRRGAP